MSRKNKNAIYKVIDLIALVVLWRAIWSIIDYFIDPDNMLFTVLSVIVALLILYLDNFTFDEF